MYPKVNADSARDGVNPSPSFPALEEQVLAYRYDGVRYDCGSKLGYLKATVALGQRHPEVGSEFSQYLESIK